MSSFALPDALFFTGIDWAAETHAVCVMDAGGKIVATTPNRHGANPKRKWRQTQIHANFFQ